MATLTCPGCAATVSHDDLICFTCGTNLPRRGPVTEESTPPTVMQEYLRPDGSAAPGTPRPAGPISPVVLRLSFPAGNVDVPAGTSLVLGRDPGESLVAAAFAGYENVSRRHATITVSDTTSTPPTAPSSTKTGCCRAPTCASPTATGCGWPRT